MKSYLQCFPYLTDEFPKNESYKTLLGPRCKLKGFIQTFSFSSADEGKVTELAFPISSHSQRKNPTPQAGSFPRLLVGSSCGVGAPGPPALGTTTGSRSRTAGPGSVAALGPAAASSSTVPNALLLTYTTELTPVLASVPTLPSWPQGPTHRPLNLPKLKAPAAPVQETIQLWINASLWDSVSCPREILACLSIAACRISCYTLEFIFLFLGKSKNINDIICLRRI